jgi:hypothetical protein
MAQHLKARSDEKDNFPKCQVNEWTRKNEKDYLKLTIDC